MTEQDGTIEADIRYRDESGDPKDEHLIIRPSISGMAPKCKLVSLTILNDRSQDLQKDTPKGRVSNILAAIDYVQQVNSYGRRIRIHLGRLRLRATLVRRVWPSRVFRRS
jgi:serine protease AprX